MNRASPGDRLFLVCVLSEVSHSSALPGVKRSLEPRAWQAGSFHPFQYMMALRETNRNLHDRVHVKGLRPYEPRSNAPTQRSVEPSVLQPRAHRNDLVAKPRSFDLSLKIPFAGGHHDASRYKPSGFHFHNSFNNPLRNHDASKPGYQFSISVPVSHASSPQDPDSQAHPPGRPHRPKQTGRDHQAPFDARPYSPWYSSHHFEETGRESPLEQDMNVPKWPSRQHHPPKYVDRYSGYYQQHPARHDYWRQPQGRYHGPHRGHYQSRAEHSSSEPWPDFQRSG